MTDDAPDLLDRLYAWLPVLEPRLHRRERVMAAPFPPAWRDILQDAVPFWRRWPAPVRAEAEPMIQAFVDEQTFTGVQGFEVTEAVKVILAACAVRPVLRMGLAFYDHLSEIVIYPHERLTVPGHGDQVLGAAHRHGVVVLSWPAVEKGLKRPNDGHDTALHEFAHIIDLADGSIDGVPPLRASAQHGPWLDALGSRLESMRRGEKSPLRDYAAHSLPEMFAVASEAFFERPAELRRRAPRLYRHLRRVYGWDPDERLPSSD